MLMETFLSVFNSLPFKQRSKTEIHVYVCNANTVINRATSRLDGASPQSPLTSPSGSRRQSRGSSGGRETCLLRGEQTLGRCTAHVGEAIPVPKTDVSTGDSRSSEPAPPKESPLEQRARPGSVPSPLPAGLSWALGTAARSEACTAGLGPSPRVGAPLLLGLAGCCQAHTATCSHQGPAGTR